MAPPAAEPPAVSVADSDGDELPRPLAGGLPEERPKKPAAASRIPRRTRTGQAPSGGFPPG
ncbi:MAG: hypothetical protein O3A01_08735 [bacterium]|nr:hypothetical protein [bacterium]